MAGISSQLKYAVCTARSFCSNKTATSSIKAIESIFAKSASDTVELSTKAQKLSPLKRYLIDLKSWWNIQSIPKISLDKETISKLKLLKGKEFAEESTNVLCKCLGIPEKLKPQVLYAELPKQMGACYLRGTHQITIPPKYLVNDNYIFSSLAHELQHAKQSLTILRSEQNATNAIRTWANDLTKIEMQNAESVYKNMSREQIIETFKKVPFEVKKQIVGLRNGNVKVKARMINDLNTMHTDALSKLRSSVIEELGILPKEQESLANIYFRHFQNSAGRSKVTDYRYLSAFTEWEAYIQQAKASGIATWDLGKQLNK